MLKKLLPLFFLCTTFAACNNNSANEPDDPGFREPVPEKTEYTKATLSYRGDDMYSEISDSWILQLYTDMEIDERGNPVGPGKMLQISLNVSYNREQLPDMENLTSYPYREPVSTGDFSAGTFNPGYLTEIDLPTGRIELPDGTFYGDIPAGTTEFEADLLREGVCVISKADDDRYTVEGILVGTDYTKRYFSYTGALEPKNYAEAVIPNTTLTEDVTLAGLSRARLIDKGDNFVIGDGSYRNFLLYLAEETIDLSGNTPQGSGELLRLEFFVTGSTTLAEGIPAGTYTVSPGNANGSIDRDQIVPFRIRPGVPDQFTDPGGSWFQQLDNGSWSERYARLADGQVRVERPDGGYRITIDLKDCGDPAHAIRAVWESDGAID